MLLVGAGIWWRLDSGVGVYAVARASGWGWQLVSVR